MSKDISKDMSKDQCFFAEGVGWEARILNIFQEELSIPGGFTTISLKSRKYISLVDLLQLVWRVENIYPWWIYYN